MQIAPDRRTGGRLTRRTAAASVLLSVVIGGAFFLLALAIDALRESKGRANHALEVRAAAKQMERLVVDIETAQRGFIVTGDARLLEPWYQARADFARKAAALERLAAAGDAGQGVRAHQITRAVHAYITEYAAPLVAAARLWGVIIAFYRAAGSREGIEGRMLAFTELVAMAVANTESRAQLAASRARVVPNC
jgi:hypothetical protein